jgi:tellurite methyltransferase
MPQASSLYELFGDIDIYLFDQLLKGRFDPSMSILDAGCGGGRNLRYLLESGYEVFAVDRIPEAIAQVRELAARRAQSLSPENFRVEPVEQMGFASDRFDRVLSSAVLHFARDEEHWNAMVDEMWRVLRPGGILFARLATTVGIESRIVRLDGRRYHLPDGSDRFLVDDTILERKTDSLGGELVEPIKSVVVHGMRSMATWVLRKRETSR